jgi:hypothetical protein
MKRLVILVAILAFMVAAGSAAAATAATPHIPSTGNRGLAGKPHGEGPRLGRIRAHEPEEVEPQTTAAAAASTSIPMTPHGGPVQDYTKTFVIFWLPTGYTFENGGSSQNFINLIWRYFSDVGGSTFANTQTQYYDSSNWVSNSSTLVDGVVDNTPYPVRNGYVYTTDTDIQNIVAKWIKARGWLYGLHEQFFVYTAANVPTWESHLGWNTDTKGYCAYHNYFLGTSVGLGNYPIVYANMPALDGNGSYRCYAKTGANWYSPNGDYTADSTVSTTSHEQFESITDPELNGWKDANGDENGDKCSYIYGTIGSDTGNVTLNGHRYILQGEWSNALFNTGAFGCAWYRSTPY